MGSERVTHTPSPIDDGVGEDNKTSPAPDSYTEFFCKELPYYLAIGMTYSQFWDEDVCIAQYYREADELKRKRKNEELWLQGLYVYNAVGSLAPILHAFAKEGTEPIPYMDEPIPITEKDMQERTEREERKKIAEQKAKLEAAMVMINRKFER